MHRADQHCNDQGGTSRGEGLKHRNANKFFTYLYLVAMWWVEGVGSRCWLVWAPVVSQGRREPCQKCLSTAASLRYSPPAYKVMVEPPAETCKFTHAQTTQLFFSLFFFFLHQSKGRRRRRSTSTTQTKAGDNKAPGTERQHRKREAEGVYARPRDAAALIGFRREESGFGRRRS